AKKIAARMVLPAQSARIVQIAAAAVAIAYSLVVIAGNDSFRTAVVHYLPPTLFLLIAFAIVFARSRQPSALAGAAGMVLTLVAIHPIYFNHNALYHAIQAVGLLLIYLAGAAGGKVES